MTYFIPATGNLFNKAATTNGTTVAANGTTTVSTAHFISDWFDCLPNAPYRARLPGEGSHAGGAAAVRAHTRNAAGVIVQTEMDKTDFTTHPDAVEMRISSQIVLGSYDQKGKLMLFQSSTRAPDNYIPFHLEQLNPAIVTQPRRDGKRAAFGGDSQVANAASFTLTLTSLLGFDNNPFRDQTIIPAPANDPTNAHKNYGIGGSGFTGNVNLTQFPNNPNTAFCRRFQWMDARRDEFWWQGGINDFAACAEHDVPLTLGDFQEQADLYFDDPITEVAQTYDANGVATSTVTGGTLVDDETVAGAIIKLVFGMEAMAPNKPKFYVGPGSSVFDYRVITTSDPVTLNLPEFVEFMEGVFMRLGARFYNHWRHGSAINWNVPANRAANFPLLIDGVTRDPVHNDAAGHARRAREIYEWRIRQYVA